MTRILGLLGVMVAFSLPMAAQDDKKKPEPFVQLVNVGTGQILAVENDSDDSAAVLVVAKDEKDKAASRQWKIVKEGELLKIVHRISSKVVDVNEASRDAGASIIIYDEKEDDNDNQRWSWVGKGDERRLKSKSSGLVLSVTDDGKVVQKKADEKDKKQLWKVVESKK